jgi:hypothetical protein
MKSFVFILALVTTLLANCHGQGFINKSRKELLKHLESERMKPGNPAAVISVSDSSITYSVRDDNMKPADFIYSFNTKGKCVSEKVIASCDSCFQKYLSAVLAKEKYRWKKMTDHQYASKYTFRLLLEINPGNAQYTYQILRSGLTYSQFRKLTGQ